MSRDELLEILSHLNPDIARAIMSGEMSIENFFGENNPEEETLIGYDISRTMINNDKYFENSKTEIVDRNGQLGTIRSETVWDCGHSQKAYNFGGIDSFGHVVCEQCIRFCDRGRHLCCIMDSKILSNGLIVCDCHRGIWRFLNSKFEKERVR